MKLDLHSHSLASDGSYTPSELLNFAATFNVSHLALTDHDTVAGIDEFLEAESEVIRIAGIEISVDTMKGEFHLVGLFIDHRSEKLIKLIEMVKRYRDDRNDALLTKLSKTFGRPFSKREILGGREGQLGRPNIANYMVRTGLVATMNDAFKRYLSSEAIADIPKKKIDVDIAIGAVKSAGGVAVLAHPSTLMLDDDELDTRIKYYKEHGLDAVEVFSSHSDDKKKKAYYDIAKKYQLGVSGGSDFHGENSAIKAMGADFLELDVNEVINDLASRSEHGKNIISV